MYVKNTLANELKIKYVIFLTTYILQSKEPLKYSFIIGFMKIILISAILLTVSISVFAKYEGYSTFIKSPYYTGIALSKIISKRLDVGNCTILLSRFISLNEYQLLIVENSNVINARNTKAIYYVIKNPTKFSTNKNTVIIDSLDDNSDSQGNYINRLQIIVKQSFMGEVKVTGITSVFYAYGPNEQDNYLIADKSIECGSGHF